MTTQTGLYCYSSGIFIGSASDKDRNQWADAVKTGKPYIVQNRYGYPHKLVLKEKEANPPPPENG